MACDFELPPRIKLDHGTVSTSGETSGDSRGTSVGANTGKKGQPWTESEHLGFLAGLKKLGKGNWRGISRLYVPSRTPTQVASHAQKHFLRLSGVTKRRSRFSTLDQAAGAQSILEAAALAGQAGPSSPEWCSTYPASTPSTHGFSAEHVFLPGSVPSEYTTWRAVPSYYGAGRGTVTAVPHETQSEPIQFTKICRPTAYRASARNGEVQKLVKLLAAASSDNCSIEGCGSLQQSSHSAFRMLKPQQAVKA
ncbi:MAG: MYB transcription factor [Trebouxia sp. A1-2]|nr:MAG: MYB transcription factor [Trebouxia sp. A1-2]